MKQKSYANFVTEGKIWALPSAHGTPVFSTLDSIPSQQWSRDSYNTGECRILMGINTDHVFVWKAETQIHYQTVLDLMKSPFHKEITKGNKKDIYLAGGYVYRKRLESEVFYKVIILGGYRYDAEKYHFKTKFDMGLSPSAFESKIRKAFLVWPESMKVTESAFSLTAKSAEWDSVVLS